jgi:DNA recombination protein RmuC
VIVTPSTLLATLKSVDSIWQNEKQKRHTIEIAQEAGKMYDKFVALLEDLKKIGERMDQTKSEYGKAINKLYEGRGDLITRAEKLKKLGAKVSKSIDQKWIDQSNETNEA